MRPIGRRGFVTGAAGAVLAVTGPAGEAGPGPESSPGPAGAGAGARAGAKGRRAFRGMWIATVANRDWPSRGGLTADEQRT